MITFRILDIFVLTVLGTGWTCCILMIAVKYDLFTKLEKLFDTRKLKRFLPFCYFCIGFWMCFSLLILFTIYANGESGIVPALLAALAAAPFIRMCMVRFH